MSTLRPADTDLLSYPVMIGLLFNFSWANLYAHAFRLSAEKFSLAKSGIQIVYPNFLHLSSEIVVADDRLP